MGNGFRERPGEVKPRERMMKAGTAAEATAEELLAVILKTGAAGCDVMELSRRILEAAGGVERLVRLDLNSFRAAMERHNRENPGRKVAGLGPVKTLELAAAFELARRGYARGADDVEEVRTEEDAARIFRSAMPLGGERERFWVLPLNARQRPLSRPVAVAEGTVNGVNVHPRDVFQAAVRWNANSVIVAHNHPSGSTAPSRQDAELTRTICEAGKLMGIPVLDHLIVTDGGHYSFRAAGKMG